MNELIPLRYPAKTFCVRSVTARPFKMSSATFSIVLFVPFTV